jgi:SAM-dependent methyltransferase
MNWDEKTIETYDVSAVELAKYFKGIGPRTEDIELALKLAKAVHGSARIVEIGCGDGRDAMEIVKQVSWYEGFDPSEGLLRLARDRLSQFSFVQASALTYSYPTDLDVIYAFASLLHVSKTDLEEVFQKASNALRKGGIFYISLKERSSYTEETKKDEHGERMFYYYNSLLIRKLAGNKFVSVHEAHQKIGKTNWFTIALERI